MKHPDEHSAAAPTRPVIHACTIVARNYLAQARVLARSFQQFHPDSSFTILVVDDLGGREASDSVTGARLLSLRDVGLDPGDELRMPMIYNVTELSTAVKPWLLRKLRDEAGGVVFYLDPDIEIFAPLDDVAALTEEHSIVLTPHVTEPIPRDKLSLSESDILGSGIYNLGFIAVGPRSESFLSWWAERLRRECVVDPARMRFTDQRWIDFVPGLFDHYILRSPAFNVAYWNLHSRKLSRTDTGYQVNGERLRFFHFSGYDPDQPHILSKHQGERPRILLSERPDVAGICDDYRRKLEAEGFSKTKRNPYGFEKLSNGVRIDWYVHQLYRAALDKFESGEGPEPPVAFDPSRVHEFVAWLNTPMRQARPAITRYMLAVHEARPDLQEAFPDPLGQHTSAFHEWFITQGVVEVKCHTLLVPSDGASLPRDGASPVETDPAERPINVVGYFRAELGVGEAARLLINALEAAGVSYNAIANSNTLSRQSHSFDESQAVGRDADINIVCVNADQTPAFAQKAGQRFFEGRYTIGVWFWEVEDFPPAYYGAIHHVDEVWVASQFIHDTLAKISPKPVFKFDLPILKPVIDLTASRETLGLPDQFTFLFSFDFFSVVERKNPLGVIEAFRRAFPQGGGPALVIKTINGDKRILDLEKVRHAAAGHPDILILDGYVSAVEKNTITALCDCYVSLHRSEGYGLTMAEAMALGKPVIATGYSGNLDFMTPQNSYLCSYTYREIGDGSAPYPAASRWAEPDLDEAAMYMQSIYGNPSAARARGRVAGEEIARLHSPARAGEIMRDRVKQIRLERMIGSPLPWDPPRFVKSARGASRDLSLHQRESAV